MFQSGARYTSVATYHSEPSHAGTSKAAAKACGHWRKTSHASRAPQSPEHHTAGPVFLKIENLAGQEDPGAQAHCPGKMQRHADAGDFGGKKSGGHMENRHQGQDQSESLGG